MSLFPMRALAAAMAFAVAAGPALAASATIRIEDAWSPPTPAGAPTAAGYLTIRNLGHAGDRLTGASSPRAAQVTLHSMSTAGGVMRMRQVTGGLAVAAGARVEVQPGDGMHLMLIGLKRPLRAGEHVPVTLDFARAGAVRADFVVRPMGSAAQDGHGRISQMAQMGSNR